MSDIKWTTEKRIISDLIPHETNPRTMTKKQVSDLKKSLKKFNLAEIPAINTDNTILAGHQRLKVMALLGREGEEIDVRVPNRPLTSEEAKEYLIRSNKNAGDWDFDILANQFEQEDLLDWGFKDCDFEIQEDKETEEEESTFSQKDDTPPKEVICPHCGGHFHV